MQQRSDSVSRYCYLCREYALSRMARPLGTHRDGVSAFWIKRLDADECDLVRSKSICANANFLLTTYKFTKFLVLLGKVFRKHAGFPRN